MRFILTIICSLIIFLDLKSQPTLQDSLRLALQNAPNDSVKFKASRPVYTFYEETNRDSALKYAQFRNEIAKKNHRTIEIAYTQGQIAYQQIYLGRFSEALQNLTEAFGTARKATEADTWELTIFNTPGKSLQITLSMLNHMYGHLKLQTGSEESLTYFKEGRTIGLGIGNSFRVIVADMVLAANYIMLNQTDSALFYANDGEVFGIRGNINKYLSNIYNVKADIYLKKGNDSIALSYYYQSLHLAIQESNISVVAAVYQSLVNYYQEKNMGDSMLYYAQKEFDAVKSLGAITSFVTTEINLGKAYENLAIAYSLKKDRDVANTYLQLTLKVKDSIVDVKGKRITAFQRLTLDEQIRLQSEEEKRVATETRRRTYILLGAIVSAVIIIFLIYRNNRQKQKANALLQKQKEEIQSTLSELKSTQQQLIQSEKMASLGELTAGIAHEIQNPLNFVNNFSEINTELIEELKEDLKAGRNENAILIANDIAQNEEKINQHGKRADGIVKGMLEHSRTSSGSKEPTDINKVADEYLRLAYHGLRAKDKSFNATLKTQYDEGIGNINITPQDIGRVLLNLYNNAFYAVNEKKKLIGDGFDPAVSVSTKLVGKNVEICIADNGNGVPPNAVDKIFQPFFTTKPTGQGTGLGLSLSYDIIKAHQGQIKINNKPGEGVEFVIQLPI